MQKRETSVRMHQIHTFYALRPKPREPETKIIHTSVQDMVFIHRIVKRTYTFFESVYWGVKYGALGPCQDAQKAWVLLLYPYPYPIPRSRRPHMNL